MKEKRSLCVKYASFCGSLLNDADLGAGYSALRCRISKTVEVVATEFITTVQHIMSKPTTNLIVKLIVGAGQASPSPPVGPALGSKGVKSMDFCKVSDLEY